MTMREIADRATQSREVRERPIEDMELRVASDGSITFDGIASLVNTPYVVRDSFGEFEETMALKAFHRTTKQKDDVRLLKNHDPNFVFARTKSGTLSLANDPHLHAVAPSLDPANPQVQTLRSEMGRGDIDQMSVGFRVRDQKWNADYTERTILEVELFDVSVVTYPASPTTSAALRSVEDLIADINRGEMSEDEIRRAIVALEARLAPVEAAGEDLNPFADRDREDLERLARKRFMAHV